MDAGETGGQTIPCAARLCRPTLAPDPPGVVQRNGPGHVGRARGREGRGYLDLVGRLRFGLVAVAANIASRFASYATMAERI